jgi:hypothetical protein
MRANRMNLDGKNDLFGRFPNPEKAKKDGTNYKMILAGGIGLGAFFVLQYLSVPNPWKGILCFFVVFLVQVISSGCLSEVLRKENNMFDTQQTTNTTDHCE